MDCGNIHTEQIFSEEAVVFWMLKRLGSHGSVSLEETVRYLAENQGRELLIQNACGDLSVSAGILEEFRNTTSGKVVWDPEGECWRWRF